MKPCCSALAVLVAGIGIGCSQDSGTAPTRPGIDTLRAALEERDRLERTYLLTSFLRTLQPEDVPSLLAELEEHRSGIEAEDVKLLMLAWTRFDGPGAFATARDWPTPWSSVLMKEAMFAWGFNDGRAALAECAQIEDEELRESLEQELVSGWVSSDDLLGAAEFAATVTQPRRRHRLAFRLAGHAKRDGADAVIEWADAVPEDAPNDFKASVFSHAVGVVARLDPDKAAPWYEREMQHAYTSTGLRNIASKWAFHHDAKSLVAWIEGLPIEPARETERVAAVKTAFRMWSESDPEEAETWLLSAAPGAMRDGAIDEYARATSEAAPAEAIGWARQLADAELRRKRTLRYSRRWLARDAAAATAWLAEADIPDELRNDLLSNSPHAKRQARAKSAERDG